MTKKSEKSNFELSKLEASHSSYMSLFDSELQKVKQEILSGDYKKITTKKIAILSLGNPSVICSLMDRINKLSEKKGVNFYFEIFDDEYTGCILKSVISKKYQNLKDSWRFSSIKISEDGSENKNKIIFFNDMNMKFDLIIGNPPYMKNLHLELLEESLKVLSEDGRIIWVAPIRWIEDKCKKYDKNSTWNKFRDCAEKIVDLQIISPLEATNIFGCSGIVEFRNSLGIYNLKNSHWNFDFSKFSSSLLDKVYSTGMSGIPVKKKKDGTTGNFCAIFLITRQVIGGGNKGFRKISKWNIIRQPSYFGEYYINWKDNRKNKTIEENSKDFSYTKKKNPDNWPIVEFQTEEETKNFYDFTQTKFFKYLSYQTLCDVHVRPKYMPWVGNVINPRTGKCGYLSNWTDEDLYTVYNLNEEEIKEIEGNLIK